MRLKSKITEILNKADIRDVGFCAFDVIKDKLIERAKKYPKQLESELKNITKLKEIIEQYMKGKEISIKLVILGEFSKELDLIIEALNKENKVENQSTYNVEGE